MAEVGGVSTARLVYSVPEVAELLGVSDYTVRQMIRSNQLRAVRAGNRVLVPRVALDEFLGAS